MTLIMPQFPRRTQQPQTTSPSAQSWQSDQPRGQVALVWADGQTLTLKPGGKWERAADNLPVKTK